MSTKRTAVYLVGLVVFMTAAAYAAVPLYRMFCQITGFDGTPGVAEKAPGAVGTKTFTVAFNADVSPALPWAFKPEQHSLQAKAGDRFLAFYDAENLGNQAVTGTATFNVLPLKVAKYFKKIECFCFTRQTLQPGQKMKMPVSFFIDPAILDDPYVQEVTKIELSYTFFEAKKATALSSLAPQPVPGKTQTP